mgnify:FL=1
MAGLAAKTCVQNLYQSFKKIVAMNKLGRCDKCLIHLSILHRYYSPSSSDVITCTNDSTALLTSLAVANRWPTGSAPWTEENKKNTRLLTIHTCFQFVIFQARSEVLNKFERVSYLIKNQWSSSLDSFILFHLSSQLKGHLHTGK